MDYLSILIKFVFFLEIFSALIGTYFLSKFKSRRIIYFVIFLWVTGIVDVSGYLLSKNGYNNLILYNVLDFLRSNFLIYFFAHIGITQKWNIVGVISLVIFNIAILINALTGSNMLEANLSYAFSLASLLLLIILFLFFNRILKTEVVIKIRKHLLVWLGLGILFYTVVEIPLVAITNYFVEIGGGHKYLLLIRVFANIIMYSLFIIGFIYAQEE